MRDEMRHVRGAAVSSPTIITVHRRIGILGDDPDDGAVTIGHFVIFAPLSDAHHWSAIRGSSSRLTCDW
jgi:hypothetical protein